MKPLTKREIVYRLIGNISPQGNSALDDFSFENLKELCELVDSLVRDIDEVHYRNKDAQEYSVKRAADYARNFIDNTLSIKD